jgi:hypothetical protein
MIDAKDILFVLGLGLLAGGLAAWDWRIAAVSVGVLFLGLSLFAYLRR